MTPEQVRETEQTLSHATRRWRSPVSFRYRHSSPIAPGHRSLEISVKPFTYRSERFPDGSKLRIVLRGSRYLWRNDWLSPAASPDEGEKGT